MTNPTWEPIFKCWPIFDLKHPRLPPERITPEELRKRVRLANLQHEMNLTSMALAAILGNYRCEIHDEDEVYPCDSVDDFFIVEENYVHCYSLDTNEKVSWFLFIPNNGSPAESFCDWRADNKQFDQFLEGVMEAFDE